jgi:hypothetical protein
MERAMTRRAVMVGGGRMAGAGALALALAGRDRGGALAQDGTPATGAGLNYPELTLTITDQSIQVSPSSIPAGYVLLTVANQQSAQAGSTGAGLVGPPAGMGMDEFMAQVMATPEASSGGFPPIAYKAVIPGGPGNIDPGQSGQAIIDVSEGTWLAVAEGNQAPAQVTVTAATPEATGEPQAAVTVTEREFSFSGLEKGVPAGTQTWKVVNAGAQPHMLVLLKGPDNMTMAQVQEIITRPQGGTPPAGGLTESDVHDAGGIFLQSTGTTAWAMLDLAAGRYVALCFVPDPRNGEPHAMEGMVAIFDAGGTGGTPTS